MVTLDDRLLGEKLQNYCSSSSDDEDDKGNDSDDGKRHGKSTTRFIPESDLKQPSSSSGFTENTGPKGVIEDWRRFKQLEAEKREEQNREKDALIKKLSMTCRSYLDDEEAKKKEQEAEDEFFDAEDDFFKEYREKMLYQMQQRLLDAPRFGKQVELNRDNFTSAIDDENKNVTVIVYVFEQSAIGCKAMNHCIPILAEQYPYVKFCRIQASEAQLSRNFVKNGCPALLVYRGGELLSSFISLTNKLGDDFVPSDVEGFLQESGYLSSAECVKSNTVRDSQTHENNRSDTDDD
ncbi:unnamed protein product [Rotaria socialis]|uniref:Phosducin domain-containing protein n=2 Tax=Rotaria socialis TaxID=392032 RepID=A0A818M8T9_9BILA|nr:unnamed protein product [Rotaria socialis]CAF3651558.1 unnamed protein product [Rotaria socialis]CAF4208893.1 unnamed protein product [Rotaria socialis]CAF4360845.1 unnamed protein product [Rotaria socialis]